MKHNGAIAKGSCDHEVPQGELSAAQRSPRTVIAVGNGASLLDSKLGETINGYDEIVRFNLFKTGRFSRDVGNRTTVWFTNRGPHVGAIRSMLKEHAFNEIQVHTWGDTGDEVASFRETLDSMGLSTPVYKVEKRHIGEMRDFLEMGYSWFSTGAIGVWLMLERYQKVTLTGFDWWKSPSQMHYYSNFDSFPDPNKGHQPLTEKIFFDKLFAMGKVDFVGK